LDLCQIEDFGFRDRFQIFRIQNNIDASDARGNADFAAINTFLTESLAIITGIYAYFTLLMVREMQKSREKLDEPNIQISLEPQVRWDNFFDLIIENLGNVTGI